MGSGPTPETKTQAIDQKQSGSSTSGPPELLQPYLKQAVEGIAPYLNKFGEGGAPALYPGGYTAPQSANTNMAIASMAGYENPFAGANAGLVNSTLQGDYLNLDKNPYFQSALTASLAPATENFAKNIIPGLRSTFAGAGRPGGGLEGTALQDATTSFDRSVADASAKVGAQAYGDERNRMLTTQGMLPSFQNMDYQRLAGIEHAGALQDAQTQKTIDELVQRHNYAETGGLDFLTGLSQRLQAAYPGGYTQGTNTTTGTTTGTGSGGAAGGNPGAENAKLAMAGIATAASVAALFV